MHACTTCLLLEPALQHRHRHALIHLDDDLVAACQVASEHLDLRYGVLLYVRQVAGFTLAACTLTWTILR